MNEEEAKLQVIAEIVRKFETHHANYYVPNEAQANFIRLFGEAPEDTYEKTRYTWVETDRPDCFLNLNVAANGTGKTDVECLIMGQMAGIIDNPWFYDKYGKLYPFYSRYPRNWRGRIISTPAAIKDTIVPRLIELFPEGSYEKEKRGKEYYSRFTGPRGSFDLMTYEQGIDEFESITLNTAFFDEPDRTPDIFLATTSRARKGMKIGFVLTPLGKAAWLHDIAVGNTKWTSASVYAKMEVNCRQHSGRGALEHDNLEEMTAGWSEDEKEARVHARWTHLSGQVYWMWDERVHVADPSEIDKLQGTVYCVCDPHTRRPNFFQWWKVCGNGRAYCFKEWPEVISHETTRGGSPHTIFTYFDDIKRSKYSFDEYCEVIREIENQIGVASDRVMDGRFGNTPYGDGSKPYYQEFCDRGVNFNLSANDPYLYRGHNRVKAMLTHQNALGKTDEPAILPKFFISSNCKNTIRAFTRYIYDPDKSSDSEAVKEDGKDEMDCVRMMSDRDDWRYRDPAIMKQWRNTFAETNPTAPGAGI